MVRKTFESEIQQVKDDIMRADGENRRFQFLRRTIKIVNGVKLVFIPVTIVLN